MEQNQFWHTKTVEQAFETLDSQPGGISQTEAAERLSKYGPNEIQAAQQISAWHILIDQFKNVLILILLGATVLSLFLGHGIESIVIAVIVLFAVLLGFIQVAYQLSVYTIMNVLTLFSAPRLRRRWGMFGYLFIWHLRGCPASMGLPR